MTRKEIFQITDGLNNTAGAIRGTFERTFEYWVLVALRAIIHILMNKVEPETDHILALQGLDRVEAFEKWKLHHSLPARIDSDVWEITGDLFYEAFDAGAEWQESQTR